MAMAVGKGAILCLLPPKNSHGRDLSGAFPERLGSAARLLADAKARKNHTQQIVGAEFAGDFIQRVLA
jgi:hypothetical protein